MSNMKRYSSRQYERAKKEHSLLLSERNKRIKSKPKETRFYICTECKSSFERIEFIHHPRTVEQFCSRKCSGTFNNRKRNKDAKPRDKKLKVGKIKKPHPWTLLGRIPWNKGKSSTYSADNARRGSAKATQTITGRKMETLTDGTRRWIYVDELGRFIKTNGKKEYI